MAPPPIPRGEGKHFCKICNVRFKTEGAFIKHILESSSHFACKLCQHDFHSAEALDRHMKQNHAHEQSVFCPGCKKEFNRAGGLISHIEYKQCVYLTPDYIENMRATNPANSGRLKAIQDASAASWAALDISPAAFSTKPPPDQNTSHFPSLSVSAASSTSKKAPVPLKSTDLIPDAASRILNTSWDEPLDNDVTNSILQRPLVPMPQVSQKAIVEPSSIVLSPTKTWGSGGPASSKLFPKASPTVAPPAIFLETHPATPVYDEHDPDDPSFQAKRYYNQLGQTYRCPHRMGFKICKSQFQSVHPFKQHLKTHQIKLERVHCPHCLRPFESVTALTQHIESQAMNCKARKSESAPIIVEDVTQIITTDGLHEDATNRYINKPERLTADQASAISNGPQRYAEANRKAFADKADLARQAAERNGKYVFW